MYENSYNSGGFFSRMPAATKHIIVINIIIMVMMFLKESFMVEHFALFVPTSPFFRPWQFITYMFLHGGFVHIFFNMYTLFIFGTVLERVLGTKRFLIFYFVTGIGAGLLNGVVQLIEIQIIQSQFADGLISMNDAGLQISALKGTPTVGASGAIYGILLGYAMLFPNSIMTLLFPPVSLKAKWFVLIFAVIELLLGVLNSGGGIAHFAHLGGMIFGFFLILYWRKSKKLYW